MQQPKAEPVMRLAQLNRERCHRCQKPYDGCVSWCVEFEGDSVIGLVCDKCQTPVDRDQVSTAKKLGLKLEIPVDDSYFNPEGA